MPVKKTTRSTTSAAPAKKVAKTASAKKAVTKKVAAKKSPAKKVSAKKTSVSKAPESYIPSKITNAYSTDITKGSHLVIVESPAKARTIG